MKDYPVISINREDVMGAGDFIDPGSFADEQVEKIANRLYSLLDSEAFWEIFNLRLNDAIRDVLGMADEDGNIVLEPVDKI